MARKKKEPVKPKVQAKTLSYTMQPEVVIAVEEIQKSEGINTISKAISRAISQYLFYKKQITDLNEQLRRVKADYRYQSQKVTEFATSFHFLFKKDLQYQQLPGAEEKENEFIDDYDEDEEDLLDDEL